MFPLSILPFTTFFHFMGESIETIATIAKHCVLNSDLNGGSKTEVWRKCGVGDTMCCTEIPPLCFISGWNGVEMVLCNTSRAIDCG